MMTSLHPLVGTWILKHLEDLVDGKWTKTFGEHPKGYFNFTSDGHVSVQFQRNPPPPSTTPDGYLAYFGTYTVDDNRGEFTTSVVASLNPKLIGTKQTRAFKISGRTMTVGDGATFRRTFERL